LNKCAIVYKSNYGSTEQYARWIAEATGGDLFTLPRLKVQQLSGYDTIVIGGGLYAGGILGFSFFKKKKLIVFSVGASFNTQKNTDSIKSSNMTEVMLKTVQYFHLRGGLDYPAMSPLHRFGMWCMKKIQEQIPENQRDSEAEGIIASYGKKISFVDKKSLDPLIISVLNNT
jgi:menaquinone-dependent protoporphyrinogen IX oxidase